MHQKLLRFHALVFTRRGLWTEETIALLLVVLVFVMPASAVGTRFVERGLFMHSAVPSATTTYDVSFQYASSDPIGSIDMLFCIDPIPYMPCVTPPGLDVSQATLTSQDGEVGYSIDGSSHTANHIMLTRTPTAPTVVGKSTYTLSGVVNPVDPSKSFSIRLRSHSTTDATGPQINFGSVKGQVSDDITIQTQVPPMLIFCLAQEVDESCLDTNETYYQDMGEVGVDNTVIAQSQMAVGTNATDGFAITVHGDPPSAGTRVIDAPVVPTASQQGTEQFGINLVANTAPAVGDDPQGPWTNALPASDYGTPDMYKYVPGDMVAYSPNVSLMRKFTVSYILNASPSLPAGVYSTTLTFVASGRF